MLNNFMTGSLNAKMHWQLCKMLLLACNTSSLFIYGFLHFIFFDFPFEAGHEALILVKLFSVASAFALGISLILILIDLAELAVRKRQQLLVAIPYKAVTVAAVVLIIILSACNGQVAVSKGIKKDLNTGLTASYSNMEPEKVLLVMNDEVINHTDIPLGERRQSINRLLSQNN
jgi:hypothetical protein